MPKRGYKILIKVFTQEINRLKQLFIHDVYYSDLIKFIDSFFNKEGKTPRQIELIKKLGLTRNELNSLMQTLYEDFLNSLIKGYPIGRTEIDVILYSYNSQVDIIRFKELFIIPRIGESIMIPFISTNAGSALVKVNDIQHEFDNGIHRITIEASDKSFYDTL